MPGLQIRWKPAKVPAKFCVFSATCSGVQWINELKSPVHIKLLYSFIPLFMSRSERDSLWHVIRLPGRPFDNTQKERQREIATHPWMLVHSLVQMSLMLSRVMHDLATLIKGWKRKREKCWGGDTNALMAWCNGNGYWADDGVVVSEHCLSRGK